MSESPYTAFEEFLQTLRAADMMSMPPADKLTEFIFPFLTNPERHKEHIEIIVESSSLSTTMKSMAPILKLIKVYDMVPFRWFIPAGRRPKDVLGKQYAEFLSKVERLSEALKSSVQPASLAVDILPVRAVDTDPSWKALDRAAVLIEARVGVRPQEGFEVRRIAFDLDFGGGLDIQVISASPETEFEVLGEREIERGESSKSTSTEGSSDEFTFGSKSKVFGANIKFTDTESYSEEYGQTVNTKFVDKPTFQKVSCTAVGANVHWDINETPSYKPVGGLNFSSTVLVPRTFQKVEVTAKLTVQLKSWGPVEIRASKTLDLVFKE